jgi:hypothetical protein
MAEKHRLEGQQFTCSNHGFQTNTAKGERHGPRKAAGSVFGQPLVSSNGYTLWLEHVTEKKTGKETFWLMWYDPKGSPTIPASSVISEDQVEELKRRLSTFIDLKGSANPKLRHRATAV